MFEPTTQWLPFSGLLLAVLLHFVWQATLIVAMVAIGRSLIHPKYFGARYLISVLGLFGVLVSPLVTAGYYFCNEEAMMSLQLLEPSATVAPTAIAQTNTFTSLLETQFQFVFNWFDNHRLLWLGGWLAGLLVLLVRLGVSLGHCFRLRRRQIPLPPHLQELAETIKAKLNLTRNVIVASSQEITQAVATGIIKPVVLVPASWVTQLPTESIEAVLAHELAHLKRWDLWINLLQRLAETVFFFHPLVWWLSHRISSEREVCCDHLAVRVTGQPMQYVETLAQVADTTTFNELEFQFGTAFIGGKNMNLLRRAKMILEPASMDAQSPFRTLALIACTGLLISYGSYAYCATPAAAMPSMQDQDQDHDHDHAHDGDHDHDHNIVVQGKSRNGERQQDGTSIVHDHFVGLMHGQESGNVDHQELARQLRRLADRLDAQSRPSRVDPNVRRRVDVRRNNQNSQVREFEIKNVDSKRGVIEVLVDPEQKNVFFHKEDEPNRFTFEWKKEGPGNVRGPGKEHDPRQNKFLHRVVENQKGKVPNKVREIREPHEAHEVRATRATNQPREREVHFGNATTSDGELGQVLRELKNEVQQLRREVNQLRAGRDFSPDHPVRLRVQDRKVQPDRRLGPNQVEGEWRLEPGPKRRVGPKEHRDSENKEGGVWTESKAQPNNVFRWDSKTKPRTRNEKNSRTDVEVDGVEIKPRKTNRDEEFGFEIEFKADSDFQAKPNKGNWTVEMDDVKMRPNSEFRWVPKKGDKKTGSIAAWFFDIDEDEIVTGGDESNSPKKKKKK